MTCKPVELPERTSKTAQDSIEIAQGFVVAGEGQVPSLASKLRSWPPGSDPGRPCARPGLQGRGDTGRHCPPVGVESGRCWTCWYACESAVKGCMSVAYQVKLYCWLMGVSSGCSGSITTVP